MSILKPILKGGLNEVRPGGWRKLRFCVDSGAGETVVNEDDLPEVETKESWGSKRGLTYEVANGAEIHNEGEKTFSGCIGTVGGGVSNERAVRAQVCAVHQPLLSVKGMCKSGHRVVFDEDGSFIENKREA